MSETNYIHNAEWYEENTPKCPNCGAAMQTISASKTPKDEPKEYWACSICGFERPK